MSRENRTGPSGMGPMSGRGAGFCADSGLPGFANGAPRRGAGMAGFAGGGQGRGAGWFSCLRRGGRGNRNWFHRTGLFGWQRGDADNNGPASGPIQTKDNELQAMKDELQGFERATEQIRTRLTELERAS
ncbi:MAG TPA: hypothetical protein DCG53_05895 [Syntrophus sp. (in: bacteria)]|jgi:hypothetical protein|nr:hypothetical protein [Syntrophus sp. (in: bacteria)]